MCSTREFYEAKMERLADDYLLSIQIVGVLSQCEDWYEGEPVNLMEELLEAHYENPLALPELISTTLAGAGVEVSLEAQNLIAENVAETYKILDKLDALEVEKGIHCSVCPTCITYYCTQQ